MKKLVLTIVALVAVATSSFAQFTVYTPCPSVSYNVPKVTYSVPKVTYNVPSTVNYSTNRQWL